MLAPPGSAGSLPAGGEASPRDSVVHEEKGSAIVRYALEVKASLISFEGRRAFQMNSGEGIDIFCT